LDAGEQGREDDGEANDKKRMNLVRDWTSSGSRRA
jgi:hypothetical protein